MHREIQIKQFPIVTTHWWPKTRNERFVWENEQYLYCFLPLVHNHVQVIWVRARIRCVTCVCARSGSRCIHTGRRRQRLTEGVSEAWCWRAVIVTTTNHILLWCCMNGIGYMHEAIWLADTSVGAWKVASAPRFRHALRHLFLNWSETKNDCLIFVFSLFLLVFQDLKHLTCFSISKTSLKQDKFTWLVLRDVY